MRIKYLMTLCDDYHVEFDSYGEIVNFKIFHN
jgi:hypothetical protein